MLKNYFKIAWRNITKHKIITLINVLGLSLGICGCVVIYLVSSFELSFDNFHPYGNQIFRLSNTFKSESESFSQAPSGPAFGALAASSAGADGMSS